eukprot:4079011-Amphidinium_carterae.1
MKIFNEASNIHIPNWFWGLAFDSRLSDRQLAAPQATPYTVCCDARSALSKIRAASVSEAPLHFEVAPDE